MSLTYSETRDSEYLRLFAPAIDAFIYRAQHPPATTSTCPPQTVLFFPGGLASQLKRAKKKFRVGTAQLQTFDYDIVWLNDESARRGLARYLKLHRDSVGVFRDEGDRIIVANGVIWDQIYPDFIQWCATNNLNLLVVDWDWRRRLEDTVSFFLRTLLPFFRDRVVTAGLPDPLTRFSLVGHSFGGMIVNLLLRSNDPAIANLGRAITVATPFYGYSGQVHRWFEGDWLVNGDNDVFKQEIMEVVTAIPAAYTLQYLDEATFRDSATQSALASDPEFPLTAYPSMDATDATVRADAYNPKTNGSLVRYPGKTGFDMAELDYARLQIQQLASPMAASLAEKFYNIRGVVTESDGQTPTNSTAGDLTWDWVPTSFNAKDPPPIVDGPKVPGDDTQPAWSARLATNASTRCVTVRDKTIHHMFIMNDPRTLDALGSILCTPGAAMSLSVRPPIEPASDEDLIAFVRWLQKGSRRKGPSLRFDDPARADQVPPEFRDKLPGITARFIMDIMKRPAPAALPHPVGGAPKASRPKPTRGRRSKPRRKPSPRRPSGKRRRRRSG